MQHFREMAGLNRWRFLVLRCVTRMYRSKHERAALTWLGSERIVISSVPTGESVTLLRGQGITHVVNCRARGQVWLAQDLAVERAIFGPDHVAHAPMWDFGQRQSPRRWAAAAGFALRALETDPQAQVLIHCQRGRRRSVMLAYAVLRLRGHAPDTAAELILEHRIEAEPVPAYVDSVEKWLAAL